jgi:general secretion pathway protein D
MPANAQVTTGATEELITLNMRDAEISAVIQWISEQTGKNIIVDPRVQGKVSILSNGPMSSDQAYATFLAMLDVYGYAVTEANGIVRIFPAIQAKTSPSQMIRSFDEFSSSKGFILYLYKANNVSASNLSKIITPLIPASGYINTFATNNSILIADESDNVKRLVDLMSQLDQSGDLNIDVIKLEYASAENVAGLVISLLDKEQNSTFSIINDERSNSLLMSGDEREKKKVRNLIAQLDRPIADGGNTQVVYLHYLNAEELVPILKGISQTIVQDSKNEEQLQSSISIESSESANAIIMTAPPSVLTAMNNVIDQIDIRRAQVLIEAVIIEVSKDFSQTLGIEWSSSINESNGTAAVSNFGLTTAVEDSDVASIIGTGLSLGFYRNGSLRGLLRAVANEADVNILSTPSIVTLDNQEAEVLVGSNIPVITGQSTTTSSTSNPFTTVERKDIGLTLKVTPQINEGDSITLDILQEVETISASVDVTSDIVTDKRSIKTKVLVEDETILVLGGLVSNDTQQQVSKVAFLGDIPVIGGLFRSTTDKITKKNLMVFIYPVIMETDKITNDISQNRYQLMNDLRQKYSEGKFDTSTEDLSDFTSYKPKSKEEPDNKN